MNHVATAAAAAGGRAAAGQADARGTKDVQRVRRQRDMVRPPPPPPLHL